MLLIAPFIIAAVTNLRKGFEIRQPGYPNIGGSNAHYWINESGFLKRSGGDDAWDEMRFGLEDFKRVWTGTEVSFGGRIGVFGENRIGYPYLKADAISSAIVWPANHILDRGQSTSFSGRLQQQNTSYYLPGQIYKQTADSSDVPFSPIGVTFQVPENYTERPEFVFTFHQDASDRGTYTTDAAIKVGMVVYQTTSGNYWEDGSPYITYSQVGTVNNLLSPVNVTFALTSTASTFEVGKWITMQYWRMRDEAVVDKLRHLAARFRYKPKH